MDNNYSYSSSAASSPRSLYNSSSYDEPPHNSTTTTLYKIKFMCSYGGQFHPHNNHLSYLGGTTKILSLDPSLSFSSLSSKLSSLSSIPDVSFKYQLPGEDLDALISVTNDEDLHHLMAEYHRLPRPARLRLFLFPQPLPPPKFGATDSDSERQWFADALKNSSPPPNNPDFCHVIGEPVYTQQPQAVQHPQQYWQERHVAPEQPVYLIQTPSGMYQPLTGQVPNQGYYGMQPIYNPVPQPQIEQRYMSYDVAGNQPVYYTTGPGQQYQVAMQESGKIVVPNPSQAPPV